MSSEHNSIQDRRDRVKALIEEGDRVYVIKQSHCDSVISDPVKLALEIPDSSVLRCYRTHSSTSEAEQQKRVDTVKALQQTFNHMGIRSKDFLDSLSHQVSVETRDEILSDLTPPHQTPSGLSPEEQDEILSGLVLTCRKAVAAAAEALIFRGDRRTKWTGRLADICGKLIGDNEDSWKHLSEAVYQPPSESWAGEQLDLVQKRELDELAEWKGRDMSLRPTMTFTLANIASWEQRKLALEKCDKELAVRGQFDEVVQKEDTFFNLLSSEDTALGASWRESSDKFPVTVFMFFGYLIGRRVAEEFTPGETEYLVPPLINSHDRLVGKNNSIGSLVDLASHEIEQTLPGSEERLSSIIRGRQISGLAHTILLVQAGLTAKAKGLDRLSPNNSKKVATESKSAKKRAKKAKSKHGGSTSPGLENLSYDLSEGQLKMIPKEVSETMKYRDKLAALTESLRGSDAMSRLDKLSVSVDMNTLQSRHPQDSSRVKLAIQQIDDKYIKYLADLGKDVFEEKDDPDSQHAYWRTSERSYHL